jgi:hypothetical protein
MVRSPEVVAHRFIAAACLALFKGLNCTLRKVIEIELENWFAEEGKNADSTSCEEMCSTVCTMLGAAKCQAMCNEKCPEIRAKSTLKTILL